MANYWTTPKVNWVTMDGIGYGDLNRIEANISANRDANVKRVQGFGYTVDNTVSGQDGVITIKSGACYSANGFPLSRQTDIVKNLTTWTQGSGSAIGGMASGVTVAARSWYYIFAIMDPTDGSVDIMFDDNYSGSHVSSGIFTEKRYIGAFRTKLAGTHGSFYLAEMYSTGDHVFICPTAQYDQGDIFSNGSSINNNYQNVTLAKGFLPPLEVLAQLNILSDRVDFGLISNYAGVFSTPSNFITAGKPYGEFCFLRYNAGSGTNYDITDVSIMVDASNQLQLAMYETYSYGSVEIRPR